MREYARRSIREHADSNQSFAVRQKPSVINQSLLSMADDAVPRLKRDSVRKDVPGGVMNSLEQRFGVPLYGVKVFENRNLGQLEPGAAFAQGNEVHLSESLNTPSGREALTHEMTHVVQQGKGLVHGSGLVYDRTFESQAGAGHAPAGGEFSMPSAVGAPVQGNFFDRIFRPDKYKKDQEMAARKKEQEKELKKYKEMISNKKSGSEGTMTEGERIAYHISNIEGKLDNEQKKYLKEVKEGNFSNWANLDSKVKYKLASDKAGQLAYETSGMHGEEIANRYMSNASESLNPMTRMAFSMLGKNKGGERFIKADEVANQRMLTDTLMSPSMEQQSRVYEHFEKKEDTKRLQSEYRKSTFWKGVLGSETQSSSDVDTELNMHGPLTQEQEQQQNVKTLNKSTDVLEKSKHSSTTMAKMLLMMQLGNTTYIDPKSGETKDWDKSMSEAFSHGARTEFMMPTVDSKEKSDELDTSIFGDHMGHDAGMHERSAGTHHLSREEVNPNGSTKTKSYEGSGFFGGAAKAFFSKLFGGSKQKSSGYKSSGYQHYGMDMAIGGIGNKGTSGEDHRQTIMNDGRSGHLYVGKHSGDSTHKGGMLVGLESDAPYRMNQTGHMHTARAAGEEGSSMGGLKTDLTGKKYGGRKADVSHLSNDQLIGAMGKLSTKLTALQDAGDRDKERAFIEKLTGGYMNQGQLENFLVADLGLSEEEARVIARRGKMDT